MFERFPIGFVDSCMKTVICDCVLIAGAVLMWVEGEMALRLYLLARTVINLV